MKRTFTLSIALLLASGLALAAPPKKAPPTKEEAKVEEPAPAAPVEPAPPEDPKLVEARAEFTHGAELAQKGAWSEALAAFERSAVLRPHPVTTFNQGVCLRAIGQYVRARRMLKQAVSDDAAAGGGQLPDELRTQATAFLTEIDSLMVQLSVRVTPEGSALAVDGRPLERVSGEHALVAGTLAPGAGKAAPKGRFSVLLDPGLHVFSVTRKGFNTASVKKEYSPGQSAQLDLELALLPARLNISADAADSVVTLNDLDVGTAPVKLERKGGSYRVLIRKPGYVPYETRVNAKPGDDVNIVGKMRVEEPSLLERWWFWAIAGTVIAGATVGTYYATRPDPERPPPNGGTLGWVVDAR